MKDKGFTEAQFRVLHYIYKKSKYLWMSLAEIAFTRELEEDDVVVVPSLIEDGVLTFIGTRKSIGFSVRGLRVFEQALADEKRNGCE